MSEDLINRALEPLHYHDGCDDCGKRSDGLMTCTYPHDGSETKLCPDCMENSGFCLRCGNFCAGIESFDFSNTPGYCIDCREEIKSGFEEFDDDDWEERQKEAEKEERAECAASCTCGAWVFGKDGNVYHVADCYCGAE